MMIILGVVLVVGIGLFLYITVKGRRGTSRLDKALYQREWQKIEQLQKQGGSGWQLAIFEADKLLDHALKALGYPGQTMGDRLKDARGVFRNNDNVWQAHKLRNRLAHETGITLNAFVVNRALQQFKAGLKDLGAF
jgi:hypothetical protein